MNKEEYDCYLASLNFLGEQTSTCEFVTDRSKSWLKINNFSISLQNLTSNDNYFIIDNTKFPEDLGAYHFSRLQLKYHLDVTIIASSAYYNAFIACKILFLV